MDKNPGSGHKKGTLRTSCGKVAPTRGPETHSSTGHASGMRGRWQGRHGNMATEDSLVRQGVGIT